MKLEGDSKISDFALPGLIEIVGYREGDTIRFAYLEGDPTNPVESILEPSVLEPSSAGVGSASAASASAGGTVAAPAQGEKADV